MPAAYIQMHLRLFLFMEANTINPDQTAPFGSSLIRGSYCCFEFKHISHFHENCHLLSHLLMQLKLQTIWTMIKALCLCFGMHYFMSFLVDLQSS